MSPLLRDLAAAAVAGAIAAVVALQLDATTPQAILAAALTGAVGAVIAVARRRLGDGTGTKTPPGSR